MEFGMSKEGKRLVQLIAQGEIITASNMLYDNPDLAGELYRAHNRVPHGLAGGFYHQNIQVWEKLLVRYRSFHPSAQMDLRIFSENEVLRAIQPVLGDRASRLVFVGEHPGQKGWEYSVHVFEKGQTLHTLTHPRKKVPRFVLMRLTDLFKDLGDVPWQGLMLPPDWPQDGDTKSFLCRLAVYADEVPQSLSEHEMSRFSSLIPPEPFQRIFDLSKKLKSRPSHLLHGDLHRKNVIVQRRDRRTVAIDWELALVGDPVYDMATHLHLVRYTEREKQTILRLWQQKMPPASIEGWQSDLPIYLEFKQVQSAINDTIRWMEIYDRLLKSLNLGDRRVIDAGLKNAPEGAPVNVKMRALTDTIKIAGLWKVPPSLEHVKNVILFSD